MLKQYFAQRLTAAIVLAGCLCLTGCGPGTAGSNGATSPLSPDSILLDDGQAPGSDPLSGYIDCEDSLPCEWSMPDSGVTVTVEAVVTDSSNESPKISYKIYTTRDTKIRILSTVTAVDSTGRRYTGKSPVVSSIINEDADDTIELLAGIGLTVVQPFREATVLATRSIARFTFEIFETGISHQVGFLQLPLDDDTGDEVDCRFRLPCSWVAKNEEFLATITVVEGLSSGRLTVHHQIEAFEDMLIQVDSGSIAFGSDGTVFEPKIHSLGDQSDYRSFEHKIFKDSIVSGTQSYFRTVDATDTELRKLVLKISQVDAPGAGSPVFINVPIN